jgi:hypothetical protein
MKQTIVGVFERHDDAQRAARLLRDSGFADTRLTDRPEDDVPEPDDGADDGVAAHIRSFFAEIFGPTPPHPAASGHAELLRRGGALVRVDLPDDDGIEAARSALQTCGAAAIEEHARR